MKRFSLIVSLLVQMFICTAAQQSPALPIGSIKLDQVEGGKASSAFSDMKSNSAPATVHTAAPLIAALPPSHTVLVNFYTAAGVATPLLVSYHHKTELPAQNSKL